MFDAMLLALLLAVAPVRAAETTLPEPAPATATLSLAQALALALERNTTLARLGWELDKSDGQLSQAWGLVLPMVQGGATWSHADHEDTVDFGASMAELFDALGIPVPEGASSEPTVVRQQDDVTASLSAALALVDPQSWASIRLARQGRELVGATVDEARQALLLGVAQAWYAVHTTEALVEVGHEQVAALEHHVDVARRREAAGVGLRIEVVRAETDRAAARQDLLNAVLAYDTARDVLGVLTGMGGLPQAGDLPGVDSPPGGEAQLVARALAEREDVRVARAQLEVARASLWLVKSSFLPTVDLAWQGSYRFTEASGFSSDDPSRWTGALTLTVPIYTHTRYGALDEKRAGVRQAEVALREVEDQAGQAVRKALRDARATEAAMDLASERALLARETLRLAETAYDNGAGSSLEVSDARAGVAAAEVNRLTTELQVQISRLVLIRELGGDIRDLARGG